MTESKTARLIQRAIDVLDAESAIVVINNLATLETLPPKGVCRAASADA